MNESWSSYYLLFVAGAVSLTLPAGMFLLHWILRRQPTRELSSGPGRTPRHWVLQWNEQKRLSTGFLLALNAGLGLILLATVLIPLAGGFETLLAEGVRADIFKGLVAFLLITTFLILGLLYASRKGDLDWLK